MHHLSELVSSFLIHQHFMVQFNCFHFLSLNLLASDIFNGFKDHFDIIFFAFILVIFHFLCEHIDNTFKFTHGFVLELIPSFLLLTHEAKELFLFLMLTSLDLIGVKWTFWHVVFIFFKRTADPSSIFLILCFIIFNIISIWHIQILRRFFNLNVALKTLIVFILWANYHLLRFFWLISFILSRYGISF